jgi:hypothetical protein
MVSRELRGMLMVLVSTGLGLALRCGRSSTMARSALALSSCSLLSASSLFSSAMGSH